MAARVALPVGYGAHLPQMTTGEQVVEEYVSMRLSLRAHPVALLRHILTPGSKASSKEF